MSESSIRPKFFIKQIRNFIEDEHSYAFTCGKEHFTEISIMGTVVGKFPFYEEHYKGFIVDDGTATIKCILNLNTKFTEAKSAEELYSFYTNSKNCPSSADRQILVGLLEPVRDMYRYMLTIEVGDLVLVHGKPCTTNGRWFICVVLVSQVHSVSEEIEFMEEATRKIKLSEPGGIWFSDRSADFLYDNRYSARDSYLEMSADTSPDPFFETSPDPM